MNARIELFANLCIDLSKTKLVNFLEEHGRGLEELSEDLTQLLTSPTIDLTETLIQDYLTLAELSATELNEEDLRTELKDLKHEFHRILQQHGLKDHAVKQTHFLHPYTLVLEFRPCSTSFLDLTMQACNSKTTFVASSSAQVNPIDLKS